MRGAECWTDHRLVRAKLMLSLWNHKRNHHKNVARQNIIVELLRDSENIRALNKKLDAAIEENLGHEHSTLIEEEWTVFKKVVLNTSKEVLGTKQRKHRDWFDEGNEEINELLNQKRLAFTTMLQNKSPEAKQLYKIWETECRRLHDSWKTNCGKIEQWRFRAMGIVEILETSTMLLDQFMVPLLQVEFIYWIPMVNSSYHRMKIYWKDGASTTALHFLTLYLGCYLNQAACHLSTDWLQFQLPGKLYLPPQ